MRALLLVILLSLVSAFPAWGADALVLQSTRDRAYCDAVKGFRASFPGSLRVVILKDYAEVDVVRLVQEERPQVVLAVGERAFSLAKRVRDTAVVTVLAPSLEHLRLQPNLTGIGIIAAPEQYLRLFRAMGKKRVGLLYDPSKTGPYVNQAVRMSRELGLTLEYCEVHSALEIQAALARLKGKVELLWMLPDSTILTAVNMEAFLIFSMQNKIPLVSYLKQHLQSGAAASLDIDNYDTGRQAGELSLTAPHPANRGRGSIVYPRKALLHTNESVLRKLGIAITAP